MKIVIHFKIKVSFRKEYVKAKEGDNIYIWWAVDMAHRSYFPVTVLILNVRNHYESWAEYLKPAGTHASGLWRKLGMTSVCNSILKLVASFYVKRWP